MSFFLIGRDEDGAISLLSETAAPTRNEALAELSRLTAEPGFDRWTDEVFVLDLDAGTPVLMVRPATVEPPVVAEPEKEAEEDDDIAALLDDLDEEDAPSLKDALVRTTTQLESEGIVAPDSVGPLPADEVVSDPEDEPVSELPSEGAPAAWPWDTAQAAEKHFDLDSLEASGNEGDSLVRAPGDDETLAISQPVILGSDFPDPPSPVSDFIELDATQTAPQAVGEYTEVNDLSALTCDDCVYTETCPNRGQLLPASCGSFQWK